MSVGDLAQHLDPTVEVLVRVREHPLVAQLTSIVDLALEPGTVAWDLGSDGSWTRTGENDMQVELERSMAARASERAANA